MKAHFDPIALAKQQIERDREATKRHEGLFEHKMDRMLTSPLAFLRGSAPLFYDLLKNIPELANGPPGEGWITGDLHVENFGAFKPEAHFADGEEAVFDLNDFDDCTIGPLRFDVLRVTTSLILAGRELGCDARRSLYLCDELLGSYAAHLRRKTAFPPEPPCVRLLVKTASSRSRQVLLDARTEVVKGERRFTRGARYRDLKPDVLRSVPKAFEEYFDGLDHAARPKRHTFEIVDAAFRIAGTGSLGCMRVAVLVRGKGGKDGHWVFDMKSEGTPSSAEIVRIPKMNGAERVLSGLRACLASPPVLAGTTHLLGMPMLVRRLTPQEDKLDLTKIADAQLDALSKYLGALAGRAHRKGATKLPASSWKDADLAALLEHAIRMAGIHEAAYLAIANETR